MDTLQLQALVLSLIGAGTTGVNGWKIFRNHERRRGITLARWFGLGAGLGIMALYLLLTFTAVSLPADMGRSVVALVTIALLLYSILV